jgi:hypothetical protein
MKTAFRLIGNVAVLTTASATSAIRSTEDHVAWVEQCLKDFTAIKPGMTRHEIEERLSTGEFYDALGTFTHPDCPYFKIDVDSAATWDKPPSQNVMIMSPSDRARTVSNPSEPTPAACSFLVFPGKSLNVPGTPLGYRRMPNCLAI